jgi:hypothetical protein
MCPVCPAWNCFLGSPSFSSHRVIAMSGAFSGNQIPCGLTADGFYEKGNGAWAELNAINGRPFANRQYRKAPLGTELCEVSAARALQSGSEGIACPGEQILTRHSHRTRLYYSGRFKYQSSGLVRPVGVGNKKFRDNVTFHR